MNQGWFSVLTSTIVDVARTEVEVPGMKLGEGLFRVLQVLTTN